VVAVEVVRVAGVSVQDGLRVFLVLEARAVLIRGVRGTGEGEQRGDRRQQREHGEHGGRPGGRAGGADRGHEGRRSFLR
jgi:hypothetical protein